MKTLVLDPIANLDESKLINAEEVFWEEHCNDPDRPEKFHRPPARGCLPASEAELDVEVRRIVDSKDT